MMNSLKYPLAWWLRFKAMSLGSHRPRQGTFIFMGTEGVLQ